METKRSYSHLLTVIVSAALLILLASAAPAQDYLLGSQDVLKITVYEHPDLMTETRVSENGKVTFPLIGELDAKGLSSRQLEKDIADKLSDLGYIKDPQVTVFIEQFGKRVTIIGEVMKPGQYEIPGTPTILDMISTALGLGPNAGYMTTVFRKETGPDGKVTTRNIPIDLDRLLNGGDLSQNIELQSGDVVYVPKAVFYVYGEVNRPGAYRLEKGITVKRAIALAGGLTPKGSQSRIAITRKEGDKEKTKSADIDDLVNVEDVIRIKESIF